MNGVAVMIALLAAPDSLAFGKMDCGCGGLFDGHIRALLKAKLSVGLFHKCRCRAPVWVAPGGGGCGGYEVAGLAGMPVGPEQFHGGPVGVPFHGGPADAPLPQVPVPMQGPPAGPFPQGGMPVPMPMSPQPVGPPMNVYPPAQISPSTSNGATFGPTVADVGQPNVVPAPIPNIVPLNQGAPPSIPPASGGARAPARFPTLVAPPPATPVSGVAPAHATSGEDFAPARMTFQVPPGTTIYVDGQAVAGAGPVRKFHTPVLPRGRTFFYEFRAEVEVNGLKVVEEKVIPLCAGDELNESFGKLASAAGR